jgi:hypothetical protein
MIVFLPKTNRSSKVQVSSIWVVFMIFAATSISSCYSFKGTSIPPEIKTVKINLFENQASIVNPVMSQQFTEALKDKFNRESNLAVVDNSGDWEFSGVITGYGVTPISPTGNETTALNRLTISVKTEFSSTIDKDENWEQSFSRFADYESGKLLSEVEDALIEEINEQIIEDIFNKVASNW